MKYLYLFVGLMLMVGCAGQTAMTKPSIDRISAEELASLMPKSIAALSLEDIVGLSKAGLSAPQVIEKIKESHSLYDLSPSQSVALHDQGVDKAVLDFIHTQHAQAVMNSLADEINKREQAKRDAQEKLKQQRQQQQLTPFCYPYGMSPAWGVYGSRFGPRYGFGGGWSRPFGCW